MKVGIVVNHPSQFFVFKNIITALNRIGWETTLFYKNKDNLKGLIENSKYTGIEIAHRYNRKKNRKSAFLFSTYELIEAEYCLIKYMLKKRFNLLMGTDAAITHIAKLFRIPSLVFNEDDYYINSSFCKMAYPLATNIVSPWVCGVGKYEFKKIGYNGYQKLAYLHPKRFTPDPGIINSYQLEPYKYFIIRTVALDAVHDVVKSHKGISSEILRRIIAVLTPYGNIIISSESNLNEEFSKFSLRIKPVDMHHLLAFSKIFIGDSQSMSVECAILGSPFIRFNDFVGKISVLEELENKYQLGYGIKTNEVDKLYSTIEFLLHYDGLTEEWQKKREYMLKDKVDPVEFILELILKLT